MNELENYIRRIFASGGFFQTSVSPDDRRSKVRQRVKLRTPCERDTRVCAHRSSKS